MENKDRPEFMRLLLGLAETYRREASEALIDGYWLGLADMPVADIRKGVAACLKTSTFMPSPAEIRSKAMGGSELKAAEAWTDVLADMRAGHGSGWGKGKPFKSDDRTQHIVRLLGGWGALDNTGSDDLHQWTRKEFLRLYGLITEDEICRPIGLPDREAMKLIGDLAKAKELPLE